MNVSEWIMKREQRIIGFTEFYLRTSNLLKPASPQANDRRLGCQPDSFGRDAISTYSLNLSVQIRVIPWRKLARYYTPHIMLKPASMQANDRRLGCQPDQRWSRCHLNLLPLLCSSLRPRRRMKVSWVVNPTSGGRDTISTYAFVPAGE